jgi:adenine-specific DNA-methyltransferase
VIKYLGSKRLLLPRILAAIQALPEVRSVLDLFSGTSRVGHACKRLGFRVLANDHNAYAATLARCYVQADREQVEREVRACLAEMASLAPADGWFTETYCRRSRFVQPHNGARIDAMREWIAAANPEPLLAAVLLTALMEAADRVDSTTGVQMAYLKQWAARSYRDLELRMPELLPRAGHGGGQAHEFDALEAASRLGGDVAYVDPPYNQHKYLGNYHVWESLVRWDQPEVYGVACKRMDCRSRKSDFNSRVRAVAALASVLDALQTPHVVVSFNDEGYLGQADLVEMLRARGPVWVQSADYQRYVGARIGIHNPQGKRVGQVGRLRNRELLFVASPSACPGTKTAASLQGQGFVLVEGQSEIAHHRLDGAADEAR